MPEVTNCWFWVLVELKKKSPYLTLAKLPTALVYEYRVHSKTWGSFRGDQRWPGLNGTIYGTTKTSAFSANAQARFALIVLDGILG